MIFIYRYVYIIIIVCTTPPGSEQDSNSNNECTCPVDTYLDSTLETPSCVACPAGMTTDSQTARTSIDQCGESAIEIIEYCIIAIYLSFVKTINNFILMLLH